MSWGWGVINTKCQKQKLNVKSSTEGEIVGVSDFIPNMIWTRLFLQEQGYNLKENILYQDNQSAMKIIMNGKKSCSANMKHIDNRFCWFKDRLEMENIKIQYCPTTQMVADFFTKPLQGTQFIKLRDVVMGYKHISSLEDTDDSSIGEERVRFNQENEDGSKSNETPSGGQTVGDVGHVTNKTVTWADVVAGNLD